MSTSLLCFKRKLLPIVTAFINKKRIVFDKSCMRKDKVKTPFFLLFMLFFIMRELDLVRLPPTVSPIQLSLNVLFIIFYYLSLKDSSPYNSSSPTILSIHSP